MSGLQSPLILLFQEVDLPYLAVGSPHLATELSYGNRSVAWQTLAASWRNPWQALMASLVPVKFTMSKLQGLSDQLSLLCNPSFVTGDLTDMP